MKGGYQIIDLRNLSLELSDSTGNITDIEILNQLRNLREYIEKGHDFTQPLNKALKCVIIRMRDGKNNEKLETCQWANIECSNSSLTYEIKTKNLMIEVVFEEKTDEYENKYYDIKTAKYLYNHNEIVEGKLTVSGDSTIGGDTEIEGDLSVGGVIKVNEYELDEDITLSNLPNGLQSYYAHARISNGKLNLVFAFWVETGVNISGQSLTVIGELALPTEVLAKLYPYSSSFLASRIGKLASAIVGETTAWTGFRIDKEIGKITFALSQQAYTGDGYTKDLRFEFNFIL